MHKESHMHYLIMIKTIKNIQILIKLEITSKSLQMTLQDQVQTLLMILLN